MSFAFPKAVTGFVDLFYPRFCPGCGEPLQIYEAHLCLACYHTLPKTDFLTVRANPMEKNFWGRLPIEKAAAFLAFTKAGKTQGLIHEVKYNGQKGLGRYLGQMFGLAMVESGFHTDLDMLIPVPLHPKKLRERGFNQAAIFGQGVSDLTGIPMRTDLVARNVASSTQTRKARYDRWLNVNSIFAHKNPSHFKGDHVLLFDDVLTTGATLEALGHTLRDGANVKISVATMGFAAALP